MVVQKSNIGHLKNFFRYTVRCKSYSGHFWPLKDKKWLKQLVERIHLSLDKSNEPDYQNVSPYKLFCEFFVHFIFFTYQIEKYASEDGRDRAVSQV
jgi:hypothetical protein